MTLQPVPPSQRIATLDILRGFAMFGVLWSNLNDWYGVWNLAPEPVSLIDRALLWCQTWLVEERFYSLLGFLFGIGFAIQLGRAGARAAEARKIFVRRMLVLLGFGLIHGFLIWRGDILTYYALIGLLLLVYERLSPKWLLVATAATFLLVPLALRSIFHALNIPFGGSTSTTPAQAQIYAHGTYMQVAAQRARDFVFKYSHTLPGFSAFLTLFLLGLWFERTGWRARVLSDVRWLRRVLLVAVAVAVAGFYWDQQFLVWGSSAAYASVVALWAKQPRWGRFLHPLGAVGRMALTTYLTQSIVCTTLFYGWGLGWYGSVGYSGAFALAVTLFAAQTVASVYWLRRHRFGPAEWLWRRLAYGTAG